MPEGVELALLPALQRVFFAAAPGASLASAPFERAHLGRLLAAGQIDAAIDVARPVRDPVRHLALDDDRFWVLTRRAGGPERAPTVKEYLSARHVVVSSRASGSVVEDEALLRQGAQREIALRCQNYATAMAVVASSDLWLTVPGRLSSAIEAPRGLRRWPLPMRMPRLAVHLYWHRHHDEDEASRWLRDLIVRTVASQLATR